MCKAERVWRNHQRPIAPLCRRWQKWIWYSYLSEDTQHPAVAAVRVDKMLRSELQLPLKKTCFWTDSMSVLKYIKNENWSFQTFVANRVTVIRDNSEVAQWRCIPSSVNPADDASRGAKAEGPEFLQQPKEVWRTFPIDISVTADDPEVNRTLNVNTTLLDTNATSQLMNHFSDWQRF